MKVKLTDDQVQDIVFGYLTTCSLSASNKIALAAFERREDRDPLELLNKVVRQVGDQHCMSVDYIKRRLKPS